MGVANKRSIAWGIAQSFNQAGARLVLSYQSKRLGENVEKLAADLNNPILLECDVQDNDQIDRLISNIKEETGRLDFIVHALAFAPREELAKAYAQTSREGFHIALDVSVYSLVAIAQKAAPLMEKHGGSIITLTYIGSNRVVSGYNVMGVAKAALEASVRYLANDLGPEGIRVNAISAGPVKTLASSGVSGISEMIRLHREKAPLQKQVELSEIGDTALFLASHLSRGVTGEIVYVDGGYNILGV